MSQIGHRVVVELSCPNMCKDPVFKLNNAIETLQKARTRISVPKIAERLPLLRN